MQAIDANGNPVNGICHVCGQSLVYVEIYEGKAIGRKCLANKLGLSEHQTGKFMVNGVFDMQAFNAWIASKAQAKIDIEATRQTRLVEISSIAEGNQALIQALTPYAQWAGNIPNNFAASIIVSLRDQGEKASDLSAGAQMTIINILSKGFRGKAKAARLQQIETFFQ